MSCAPMVSALCLRAAASAIVALASDRRSLTPHWHLHSAGQGGGPPPHPSSTAASRSRGLGFSAHHRRPYGSTASQLNVEVGQMVYSPSGGTVVGEMVGRTKPPEGPEGRRGAHAASAACI